MLQGCMKYLIAIAIFLTGCSDPSDFAKDPVVNNSNQTITFIRQENIHGWVKEHMNIKIIALSSFRGGNCDGYIVVYEAAVKVEK